MFKKLIQLTIKEALRSPAFNQNLVQSVFLSILFIYFALNLVVLGIMLGKVFKDLHPEENIYLLVGGGLFYYAMFDVIARVILQKFPVLNIRKYLHHNIPKSSLIHYLLIISIKSFFNYLPLFAFIPFLIVNWSDIQAYGMGRSFVLIISGIILFNNYLSFGLDRLFRKNSYWPYAALGVLVLILFLDIQGFIELKGVLDQVFAYLSGNMLHAFLLLFMAVILYAWNYRTLKAHLYIEDIVPEKVTSVSSLDIDAFDRLGKAGKLMRMEVKLIWRNRRSRMGVYMSIFFLFYPLLFTQEALELDIFKYFVGLFVTGIFAISYGQLMLSWNSTHFDLLATRNIKITDIFYAKYYIMILSCFVLYLFSLPYGLVDLDWIKIFTMMFLFNAGVSIFLYMLLASYNSKRIDPGKGAMMNYEGIGVGHFIIIFPLMVLPALIKWPFSAMGYGYLGDIVITGIGLLGIIFHKRIINFCINLFLKNRYKIMAAFRKKV